ncbi:uncharacterized protein EV420DRAFT_1552881 [Desarmillaria tabescens]|uniref:Uncharacterized protein n=1 Tax=Armillaria tabescens TaxID=1929756 RepID=A0AA39K9F0_ARMTA|nr:uncharacterized protein EV420DRAFT_1552881 [Desarmillaria tabescens]KAK0455726.1 hypothetical protein EV420DRAFT_1552881 [Desarmillaria tabescens]
MPNIVNKAFMKYIYPAVLIIDKNPITTFTFLVFNASLSSQWLPFGLVAYIIAVYAVHHFSQWLKEDTAKKAKLEEIQSISLRLGLYIIHERFHFAVYMEDTEALQFCSSVITQRFDVTDQKAKALDFAAQQALATSDELAQISFDLRMLDAHIQGVIRSYSRLKTKLQSYAPERQLEAAECWVADTNEDFPPVAAGPANEDSFRPSWAWWKRE